MDFNSDPFTIAIIAGATEGRANISVTCDDVIEGLETFDLRLSLVTSNPQITLGTSRAKGEIIDSSGKWIKLMSYLLRDCYIVGVRFSQSSYEVMEGDGTVTLTIQLSQMSSVPFEVTVNTMDVTAVGKWNIICYQL